MTQNNLMFWNCYAEDDFINIPVRQENNYIIYYMLDKHNIHVRRSNLDEPWDSNDIIEDNKVITYIFESKFTSFIQ